jgi:hypothetical protein
MRIDSYTRVVLSVIALALVWLCFQSTATPVGAQSQAQRVVIVGWEKPLRSVPMMLVNQDGNPVLDGDSLRVVVANHEGQAVPIEISSIGRGSGRWESLPVDVMKDPGSRLPGDGGQAKR